MPRSILFRTAAVADVAAIDEIERASFIHAGERFVSRKVRHLIRHGRAMVIVAESEGQVVGWSAGLVWTRGVRPWGRIYALAIHPTARGRRLGPRLLGDMIEQLRRRGAGPIFLEVRTDNHAALRLYEQFGFTPCKTLVNYYGRGLDARRMQLPPA